jgi:alpha-mannosidase
MHWVDMEWLWGYFVLPESVRDMLWYCRKTGTKGNINFDAVGYEKLAVQAPQALASLREAIAGGTVEVVGASYGQPYGLFHGGESNIRQRVYGVRSVLRHLDARPRSYWEEEYDYFPQLPQMLRGVGFTYASLFYQWTWHTPHIPMQEEQTVYLQGLDGSQLLAATRNSLNLHQWPEDFEGLLDSNALSEREKPGILQWLELMPSPDWMCRAELMLPQMQNLQRRDGITLRAVTLSELLEEVGQEAQPRYYDMAEVFHGVSLGKNGDLFRRRSRACEESLLTAESLSTMMGFLGRPYPSWNVYPEWELGEAWKELLVAQHHDNDECEGLCGHVGASSYDRSLTLSDFVTRRALRTLASRFREAPGRMLVYNPLGWERSSIIMDEVSGTRYLTPTLPPFGYRVLERSREQSSEKLVPIEPTTLERSTDALTLRRGDLAVEIDTARGLVSQIYSPEFPAGALSKDESLGRLHMTKGGAEDDLREVSLETQNRFGEPLVRIQRAGWSGTAVMLEVSLAPDVDAVDLHYSSERVTPPDPSVQAALKTLLPGASARTRIVHDHPYGITEIEPSRDFTRKYPTGHWMTSEQVYEQVERPFTALSLLDIHDGSTGLLYLHNGNQSMQKTVNGVEMTLTMNDPWDGDYFVPKLDSRLRVVPHGALDNASRYRYAQEFTRPVLTSPTSSPDAEDASAKEFAPIRCRSTSTLVTALYRDASDAGDELSHYALPSVRFPLVIRLVEWNGNSDTATLQVSGRINRCMRTNLLGEEIEELEPQANEICLSLSPFEIATLYLDIDEARKVEQDLDAYRHVWARAHRTDEDRSS